MKKVNPKVVALALIILTSLATGGVVIKYGIAPRGIGSDPNPDGG